MAMADVNVVAVKFDSGGCQLAGNLYLPGIATAQPAVVVTGTWTSIKEQMADRYAQHMADRGFVALSFDFTNFGESEGRVRDLESPWLKVRDIHNAVTFLAARPEVDARRLGALGVCASAGYTAVNAVRDERIRGLALVAPWLHNADIVEEIYEGPNGVARRISAALAALAEYELTGDVQYVPAVSADDPEAAMPWPIDFYLDPDRGGIPAWPNRFAVMAWTQWLTFDPIAQARRIVVPTLMVHSEDAAIPQGAHAFYDQLPAAKQAIWTTGDQFDFYDGATHVADATDAAAEFLATHLA